MSRFIYKPLTGYTPENRKEFLKLYKESIRKGELLVDLLNYDISLTEMKKGGYFYYKENFNTYEEAELECLKKLIEIVKEDKQ